MAVVGVLIAILVGGLFLVSQFSAVFSRKYPRVPPPLEPAEANTEPDRFLARAVPCSQEQTPAGVGRTTDL
jgi:hypothetical protein